MSGRNFNIMIGASLCAQAIKISHAMELLETQTLSGLKDYLNGLMQQAKEKKSKGVQTLVNSPDFKAAYLSMSQLIEKNIEHPKIEELKTLIEQEFQEKENAKIIVFTQFRETASAISKNLNKLPKIKASVFIGQAKKSNASGSTGLSQKEQKQIIDDFKEGKINVICATSIGEEGLDIPEVNAVYFYEPVPSAIRKIQRAGRTARLMPGKLAILITKDTRDQIYHYASTAKERKMYKVIDDVKEEMKNSNSNPNLDSFVNKTKENDK
jgi:Fanconi anemia group M protein